MDEVLNLITNQHFVEGIQQQRFGGRVHALAAHQKLFFDQIFDFGHIPSTRVLFQQQLGLQLADHTMNSNFTNCNPFITV
jgi:hypothetical protein